MQGQPRTQLPPLMGAPRPVSSRAIVHLARASALLFAGGAALVTGLIVRSVLTPSIVEGYEDAGDCEFARARVTDVIPARRVVEYQYGDGRERKRVTEEVSPADHDAAGEALRSSGGASPVSDLLQGSSFSRSMPDARDIDVWVSPSRADFHRPEFQRTSTSAPPPGVADAQRVRGRILSVPPAQPHLVYEFAADGRAVREERLWWDAVPPVGTSFEVAYRRSKPAEHVTALDHGTLRPSSTQRIGWPAFVAAVVLGGILWPVERQARRARHLLRDGVETTATVLEIRRRVWVDIVATVLSLFAAAAVRGATSCRVTYSFLVGGKTVRASRVVPGLVARGLARDARASVLYDPDDPSNSQLRQAVETFAKVVPIAVQA